MQKLRVLELFGGIGACSKALEKLGVDFEIVDYVEIDKYAVKSFNIIHNTNFEPQDITTWNKDIEVDLIMHGSPCQDFSLNGKQAGGDEGSGTRSSLMYETIRIVEKLKPKYIIWENVKNLISKKHRHNFDSYLEKMESLGYKNYYQVLNAKDYGIPQNRERIFTISIRNDIDKEFVFPEKQELKLKLKDMLEDNVDEKYFLSDKQIHGMLVTNFNSYKLEKRIQDINGNIDTLTTSTGSRCPHCIPIKNNTKLGYQIAYEGDGIDLENMNSTTRRARVQKEIIQTLNTSNNKGVVFKDTKNYIEWKEQGKWDIDCRAYKEGSIAPTCTANSKSKVLNNLSIRKLTPKECWRLMGFDDSDFDKTKQFNSDTQLYKQAGNSIVVNVLIAVLKNLLRGEE